MTSATLTNCDDVTQTSHSLLLDSFLLHDRSAGYPYWSAAGRSNEAFLPQEEGKDILLLRRMGDGDVQDKAHPMRGICRGPSSGWWRLLRHWHLGPGAADTLLVQGRRVIPFHKDGGRTGAGSWPDGLRCRPTGFYISFDLEDLGGGGGQDPAIKVGTSSGGTEGVSEVS
eukprot:134779-Hanusia_phi.AAC.7